MLSMADICFMFVATLSFWTEIEILFSPCAFLIRPLEITLRKLGQTLMS